MKSHIYPPPVSPRAGTAVQEPVARPERVAPRTGISPLARNSGHLTAPPIEHDEYVVETTEWDELEYEADDRPRVLEGYDPHDLDDHDHGEYDEHHATRGVDYEISSRFDFLSYEDEMLRPSPSFRRRFVQGLVVLSAAAATGALVFVLPESDGSILGGSDSTTRVEAAAKPVATADQLTAAAESEVDGSLQLLSNSGRLASASDAGGLPPLGELSGGIDGYSATVTGSLGGIGAPPAGPTTTTTTWVEPTIPPESEWVDAGNGVRVPDVLLRIRFCESTNNYQAANRASTARGAYQFLKGSWEWYGHAERTGAAEAHLATPAQQDEAAVMTLQSQGTGPWTASRGCWADPDINPNYATALPPRPAPTTSTTAADGSTTVADDSTTTTAGGSTTSDTGDTTTTTADSTTTSESTTTTADSTTTSDPSSTTTDPPPSTNP